ncbi:MAG: hypothetical protein LC744_04165 [Chloroflexi bacterium]|nr:hypothetical protein [Chloroflexota bacterium]
MELDPPLTDAEERSLAGVLAAAGGETLSAGPDVWRARLTASPDAIDHALDALRAHGLRSLVRAGAVAMAADPTEPQGPTSQNGATQV